MGTQNQAIGKSKGGMATKRLVVLPRGERPTPTTSTTSPPLFQFALPRGERRAGCHGRGTVLQVSIRAPAWGATPGSTPHPAGYSCFNSRSRVGSDPDSAHRSCFFPSFNSRSRVGSDNRRFENVAECCSFNSRSRVGSDFCSVCVLVEFQFALPRGERLRRRRPALAGLRFQLALPREERLSRAVVS